MVFLTWLFNGSGGSLLIVVWHGCLNFISSTEARDGLLAVIVSAVVMIWAVVVIARYMPGNLAPGGKIVL